MERRRFLALTAGLFSPVAPPEKSLLLLSAGDAGRMRDRLRSDPAASRLRKMSAAALEAGPWSVTFHRPTGVGAQAGPNDYVSEGPYWWPDPKNPGGPYIRKDGERNPGRFLGNRNDLADMCEAVLALSMAAYFLGDAHSAGHAAKVLSVWFLDPKTRMNPHLEFGQAIRGHNDGRGAGMIDTVSLIHAAQGIALMERAGKLDRGVAAGMRRWYADYLKWMTTSKKGLDEKKASNNHATWWTAQVAAYAGYVDDPATRTMAWDHCRNYLVPSQVQPNGSCPREEARTRSLSYSSSNLDGFSVICRLAQMDGVDLWRYRTPKGTGVEKAFYYLMPYVVHPATWRKPQITSYDQDRSIFLGLAGLGLQSSELLAAYRKLPRADVPWVLLIDSLVRTSPWPAPDR
jgi:hypothetical protein